MDEAVDQRYLDAPSYQAFREASRSETGQSLKDRDQLVASVRRAIRKQAGGDSKTIPFTIGEDYIDRLLKEEGKETGLSFMLSGQRQRFYYLATAGDHSLGYHFFLLCKVSAYKNCGIGLATSNSGKTVDLSLLAPFKHMLTYDEISTLKINPQEIHIETRSQVRYPIEQENVYQKRYVISAKGNISESDSN